MLLDHHEIFQNWCKSDILLTYGHFRLWKFSFQDQGGHKKPHVECVFQLLMLNIYSIKELLHKTSKIHSNITGTLPRKLKRKIYWALSYKIFPPEITKTWEIDFFFGGGGWYSGGQGTSVEFNGFWWFCKFLKVSVSIF